MRRPARRSLRPAIALLVLAVVAPALVGLTTATPSASASATTGAVASGTTQAPVVVAARRSGFSLPDSVFNVPRPWGTKSEQSRLVRTVESAINKVPKKSRKNPDPTIAISGYLLDRAISVTALIDACRRGVGIRVLLDEDIINKNSRRLISALNGDNVRGKNGTPKTGKCGRPLKKRSSGRVMAGSSGEELQLMGREAARSSLDQPLEASKTWGRDRSYVKQCSGACRNAGDGGNMHTKMYLFSRTGKYRNVTMISSSNLNRGGMKAGWNDMVILKDRPKTYKYHLKVHRAMTKEVRADKDGLSKKDGPYLSRFFPIRKAGKAKDPVLADLNKVKCNSGFGKTQINISMFYWAKKRGNWIADKLLSLARQGCKVSIIYGAPSRQIAGRLREAAGRNLINLFDSRWDHNEDGYNEVRTHGKYMLIKGNYRGDNKAKVVMTGSANWVGGSLRLSDESTINVDRAKVYNAYIKNWNVVRNHSRRLPYN